MTNKFIAMIDCWLWCPSYVLTYFWWWGWAPAASSFSTTSGWLWKDADIRAVHPLCERRGKDNRWWTEFVLPIEMVNFMKHWRTKKLEW